MNSFRSKTYNGLLLKLVGDTVEEKMFRGVPPDTIKRAKQMMNDNDIDRIANFHIGYDWNDRPIWQRGILLGIHG